MKKIEPFVNQINSQAWIPINKQVHIQIRDQIFNQVYNRIRNQAYYQISIVGIVTKTQLNKN